MTMICSQLGRMQLSETLWRALILILSAGALLLTVWSLSNNVTIIFMHFYYFPIVLIAYRYGWKGVIPAALLALAYLGLVVIFAAGQLDVITGAVFRAGVFVGIALVIACLSEELARRTRELALAKEAAESADRLKSAFLATISHELRTPLNSIIGFSGILQQELAGPVNEEQKKQLGMISDSAEHLLALINDVLDISKIEAGQMNLASGPVDIAAVLEKVVRTMKPLADGKNLSLAMVIAPDAGNVRGDARRIEQVILNLMSNAVKFTSQGGIRIVCSRQGEMVTISVADTGIGIRAEDQGRLFRPFVQVDTGLARQHEGTGLGLSISKKLMDLMNGTISVESTPGRGSTFTAALPRDRSIP